MDNLTCNLKYKLQKLLVYLILSYASVRFLLHDIDNATSVKLMCLLTTIFVISDIYYPTIHYS